MKTHTILGGDAFDMGLLSGRLLGYLDEIWVWIHKDPKFTPSQEEISERVSAYISGFPTESHQAELLRTLARDFGNRKAHLDSGFSGWINAFRTSCACLLGASETGTQSHFARQLGLHPTSVLRRLRNLKNRRQGKRADSLRGLEDLCDLQTLRLAIRPAPSTSRMISEQVITEVPFSWARFSLAMKRFSAGDSGDDLKSLMAHTDNNRRSVDFDLQWLGLSIGEAGGHNCLATESQGTQIEGGRWVSTAFHLGIFEAFGHVLQLEENHPNTSAMSGGLDKKSAEKEDAFPVPSFPNPLQISEFVAIDGLETNELIKLARILAERIQNQWPNATEWIGGGEWRSGNVFRVIPRVKRRPRPAPNGYLKEGVGDDNFSLKIGWATNPLEPPLIFGAGLGSAALSQAVSLDTSRVSGKDQSSLTIYQANVEEGTTEGKDSYGKR